MVQFTTEMLASWRLEGYSFISVREYLRFGYVSVHPCHEDVPETLKIMFKADAFPIYIPLMDMIAAGELQDGFRYFVSDNYDLYRNFDPEYIDMEADF